MIHILKNNAAKRTLVLLHGTGGDEHDLVPIARMVAPDANVLSIRGNVRENGMNRFFKRLSPGVFDLENLVDETHRLHDFILDVMTREGLDTKNITVLGYSNGANIATSVMMFYPDVFKEAVLLRPMVPLDREPVRHEETRVLVSFGKHDPIVPRQETKRLIQKLKDMNIRVTHLDNDASHQLIKQELDAIRIWLHQDQTQHNNQEEKR